MKYLSILFGILLSTSALADCASSGLTFYPEKTMVPKNSYFIIEGYYFDQQLVRDLGDKTHAYLMNGRERIELETVKLYEGMMHLTMAVMKPMDALQPGVKYTLKIIDEEGNSSNPQTYDGRTGDWREVYWKVGDRTDDTSPKWTEKVAFSETSYTPFGCGPAVYASFTGQVFDESETLIQVELNDLTEGETNSYLIKIQKGHFSVGHGMCSGAFKFIKKHRYQVRVKLMDLCGNQNDSWSEWMRFKNPLLGHITY